MWVIWEIALCVAKLSARILSQVRLPWGIHQLEWGVLPLDLLQKRLCLKELRSKEYLLKSLILVRNSGWPYHGGWGGAENPDPAIIYACFCVFFFCLCLSAVEESNKLRAECLQLHNMHSPPSKPWCFCVLLFVTQLGTAMFVAKCKSCILYEKPSILRYM
jgi:hypothetical protein